jgi:homoserine O-succinyltransferase
MPIIIPGDIPAFATLQRENVFVMNQLRAQTQDIRPIEIAILNLMPTKIETETQLLRLLSNSPLQVNLTFIKTSSYISTNISAEHLSKFYVDFSAVKTRRFDGMIITGAPVETMDFSAVKYWDELCAILNWQKQNVTSTLFICWGAQAGLYHHYGIGKLPLPKKISGVFPHEKATQNELLLKGVDDIFFIPHSRYTKIDEAALSKCPDLETLARGKKTGSAIIKNKNGSMFFLTGHGEYDSDTLAREYKRDLAQGLKIAPPANYFNKDGAPVVRWRGTANLIFYNWLNYYVYQITPYVL